MCPSAIKGRLSHMSRGKLWGQKNRGKESVLLLWKENIALYSTQFSKPNSTSSIRTYAWPLSPSSAPSYWQGHVQHNFSCATLPAMPHTLLPLRGPASAWIQKGWGRDREHARASFPRSESLRWYLGIVCWGGPLGKLWTHLMREFSVFLIGKWASQIKHPTACIPPHYKPVFTLCNVNLKEDT